MKYVKYFSKKQEGTLTKMYATEQIHFKRDLLPETIIQKIYQLLKENHIYIFEERIH